jgi:hypothetical protein
MQPSAITLWVTARTLAAGSERWTPPATSGARYLADAAWPTLRRGKPEGDGR